jgi:hypothetical protein
MSIYDTHDRQRGYNETHYFIKCQCGNCRYKFSAQVERGKNVPASFECPKCGCQAGRHMDGLWGDDD